jgi:hypothetical protein
MKVRQVAERPDLPHAPKRFLTGVIWEYSIPLRDRGSELRSAVFASSEREARRLVRN